MSEEVNPYLVAVSGGVDSMVLLDLLVSKGFPVIVAHVDHGIRTDSSEDKKLVEKYARAHNLPFTSTELHLGTGADESLARDKRYEWLYAEQERLNAGRIVTAHHLDDVIETIIHNIRRGTGWRGLCSLRAEGDVLRPLIGIGMSKVDIVRYAIDHGLDWREDSTNEDMRYSRNAIRHGAATRLSPTQRQKLLALYRDQCSLRREIEKETAALVERGAPFSRYSLIMCDTTVAEELVQAWLGAPQERATLRRVVQFAKTAYPGARLSLGPGRFLEVSLREMFVSTTRD